MKDVLDPPDINLYGESVPGPDYEVILLNSTEYILESGESVLGPDLPLQLFGHTVVGINETSSLIIGGAMKANFTYYHGLDKTWIFDHVTETFTEGPKLNVGRSHHSAGVIIDSDTNERTIVVTGGIEDSTSFLNSTEILKGNYWEQGM